jgi:dTDP-4-dehydrorhamnose 3,5-epimerase
MIALYGVKVIEKTIHPDDRGFFIESYKRLDNGVDFVQDNLSYNKNAYTLRGLHFQKNHAQGKYVSVICLEQKEIVANVVIVDLRKMLPSYGKWRMYEIGMNKSLYIPSGFAHGFVTLYDNVFYSYKCTDVYVPDDSYILKWNDPDLNIDWGVGDNELTMSDKDKNGMSWKEIDKMFEDNDDDFWEI